MTFVQPRQQIGIVRKQNFSPSFKAELTNSLVLNVGTGDPTFDRTTTGTVVDFEGIINTAKIDESRFSGARRVENLTDFSQTLDNATGGWTVTATTVTLNNTTAPDGTTTADKLTPNSGTGTRGILKDYSGLLDNQTYYFSCYAKMVDYQWIRLFIRDKANNGTVTWFDLENGVVGTDNNTYSSIESLGDDWYRCTIGQDISSGGTTPGAGIRLADADNDSNATGNGSDHNFFWGVQLEEIKGTQTDTSEYVSTDVLSSPFHGANVDGVKYFTTDRNGDPISSSTLKGYLSEEQRTNICLQSEDFTTTWLDNAITVTADQTTAPDSTTTADNINVDTAAGSRIFQDITVTASTDYDFSFYQKAGTLTSPKIAIFDVDNAAFIVVDLAYTPSTEWSREMVSFTTPVGCTTVRCYPLREATDTGNIYLWGAQLELGSFASSYIATTTTSVTRTADSLSYPATGNIEQGQGSIVCEFNQLGIDASAAPRFMRLDDGTGSNRIELRASSPADAELAIVDGGVTQTFISAGNDSYNYNEENKIGVSYILNNVDLFLNGTLEASDTSATIPTTLNIIRIGQDTPTTNNINGNLKNVQIYKPKLDDTVMEGKTN